MDLLTYFVILLLPFGSSSMISQNDLAFWTLLKEYHEMDLPAQDLGECNESSEAAAPLRVAAQRWSEEAYDSAPDDVALRLHVEMKSEPVQLRVRCARGCRYLRRPCDLFVAPGYPLRLDYHTSESICASFESAGRTALAEKSFRLMLEPLGVRLRPANWTEPLPQSASDEQISWLLAAAGLFAVLLGAFIVVHFELAYWTPCSWTWFEQEEPSGANNIPDRCCGGIKNALLYDPNDPGRKIEIKTGDSLIIGGFVDSKNFYKMVVVVVDSKSTSSQEMMFLLPVPTSCSYLDGDDSKRIEIRDNKAFSRDHSCTHLNSPVFPTGVIESGELLHGSQTIPLGYSALSSSGEQNSLPNCQMGSSHLEDCSYTGDSTLRKIESSESPLLDTCVKNKSRNKPLTLEPATENVSALDSSLYSTAHATEEEHAPPDRGVTTKKLREQKLTSFYCSLPKSKDLLSQEVSSTLLTSPCPEMSYRCFTSYQATSSHQVPRTPISQYSMSLAYPTTWVYPMILPQTIPLPFAGSPICSTITQDPLNASEGVNTGSSRYSASSVHPITPAYPAPLDYLNTNAFLETGPCPDAVVYSSAPTYTITPTYSVTPSGIATSTYPGAALPYPVLPRYPQPAVTTGSPNVSIDSNSHYHGEPTGSRNMVQPPDEYHENSAYRENSGCQITDYRREPTYPPTSEPNPEYCPDLSNYQENNVYQTTTAHLTRQCPAISYNPASNVNSCQMVLGQQTNPSNPANMLGSVYQPLPRRKQASGTHQVMNNPPAIANQRISVNRETRGYTNQRHSNSQRPSSDHRYFINQGNTGYQRNSNQRHLDPHRYSTNTRPLANQRSNHQRSQAYLRATSHRPTNVYQIPLSFQPGTTFQPGVPYRSCTGYQMTPQYQPSSSHSAVNYQMRPVYQRLDSHQPTGEYQSSPIYQQSNLQDVDQPGGITQANSINGSRTTNQHPILYPPAASNNPTTFYETTPIQASNHNPSAPFRPTYTHEQISAHSAPSTFQETSGYQPVHAYNPVPTHQLIPPLIQPSVYQTNAYSQPNRQYFPMYQQSYVTSLPEDCQQPSANQVIPNNNTTFYPVPFEGVPSNFDDPISGYCANSPCTQECPYFDGSLGHQTIQTEQPYQENMANIENTSEYTAAADRHDDDNYSRGHQLRPDCPEVFPRPNPTNMESQIVNSTFRNPPVYFYPVNWRNNYVNQSTTTPSNQIASTDSSVVAPSHTSQIPEAREENATLTYPLYPHISNGSEFHDSQTPVYNPVNCVYCVCNPGVPVFTAIPPDGNYSTQGPGQVTGGGDAELDHISNANLISGERCVDQASNVIPNNETQPGYGTHVELGSGDSHLVQCCEQPAFQEQNEQYYSPTCDVLGNNVCHECETVANRYGANDTISTQYCYECSRLGYCSTCHENCNYVNGYINPTIVGQNSMMRGIPNDISENFSRLSLQNSDYSASYNAG